MEDFKKQIAALESWHNEDKEKRALIFIAIEDVDKEHHNTTGAIIGGGRLLTEGVASMMKDQPVFRRLVKDASLCLIAPNLGKVAEIIAEAAKNDDSDSNESNAEGEKQ